MIEVNAETDFVAKNETFKTFVRNILKVVVANKPADIDALKAMQYDADFTVEAKLKDMIFTIGENMNIRRFVIVDGITSTYVHGGGIAGYTASGSAITDCYATGTIRTISANECNLGGICGSYFSNTDGATITNCYSTSTVIGSGGNASYVGGLSPIKAEANYVNSYYLEGTVSGASPKYGITGLGTAKTADELKALAATLGDSFAEDSENINGGYPILAWQGAKQPLAGDVNADGTVDVTDAELVYNYSIGAGELTEAELILADMDGDGHITAKDAAMIYAIIAAPLAAVTE